MKPVFKSLLLGSLLVLPLSVGPVDNSVAQQTKTEQTAPDIAKFDEQMAKARKQMQEMQEQMAELQKTEDPQKRQKLLQEHWDAMQNAMQTMSGMWEPGMMGCCGYGMSDGHMMMGDHMMGGHMMGWDDSGDYYKNLTPEQMQQRQYMMDQYMGMQQMMMDHMMRHQHWRNQPPEQSKD